METELWYKNPEWWSAIGTIFVGFVAVCIAIFQEKIINFFRKTKIVSTLKLFPPDCHKIKLRDEFGGEQDCYYIRTKISNDGKTSANNVEVMINKCWKYKDDSAKKELKTFLPMNLKWSHYGKITLSKILPNHFRHCDIGSFRLTYDNKVVFVIDTAVQPNRVEGDVYPNILEAGEYRIDLLIGADNVDTFSQSYKINFSNEFYNNEADMFSKNISINKMD